MANCSSTLLIRLVYGIWPMGTVTIFWGCEVSKCPLMSIEVVLPTGCPPWNVKLRHGGLVRTIDCVGERCNGGAAHWANRREIVHCAVAVFGNAAACVADVVDPETVRAGVIIRGDDVLRATRQSSFCFHTTLCTLFRACMLVWERPPTSFQNSVNSQLRFILASYSS